MSLFRPSRHWLHRTTGGGLYLVSSATVTLDAFTQSRTTSNTATTSDPNISGSYTLV